MSVVVWRITTSIIVVDVSATTSLVKAFILAVFCHGLQLVYAKTSQGLKWLLALFWNYIILSYYFAIVIQPRCSQVHNNGLHQLTIISDFSSRCHALSDILYSRPDIAERIL